MEHSIQAGDAEKLMQTLEKESVDLVLTSPPYWAKRVYSGDGDYGAESSPVLYVERMANFFDRLKTYVKPGGNLFINMGDTYFGSGSGAWKRYENAGDERLVKETFRTTKPLQPKIKPDGKLYQRKQLLMIPARFAIAMQERGFILREDIIWNKPNRIPSGVSDRCINTYEHVFHFVMRPTYYFNIDALKIPAQTTGKLKTMGDVWNINTQALPGGNTASFPEELAQRIILCGCPEGGTVLDPFIGTGTTWIAAEKTGRRCIGYDISDEYINFSRERFKKACTVQSEPL